MKQRLQVETSSARPPAGCGRWVPLSHPDSRARPNPPQIRPNFCTLRAGRVPKPDEQRVSDPCACQAKAESCKFFFFKRFSGCFGAVAAFQGRLLSAFWGYFQCCGAGSFALLLPPRRGKVALELSPNTELVFAAGTHGVHSVGASWDRAVGLQQLLGNARGREKSKKQGDANPGG